MSEKYQTVDVTCYSRAVLIFAPNPTRNWTYKSSTTQQDFKGPLCIFLRLIEHSENFVTSVDKNSFLSRSLGPILWTLTLSGERQLACPVRTVPSKGYHMKNSSCNKHYCYIIAGTGTQ